MFITEVIIDGFKSYSSRTVVSGFDPHFNAITGLNGSGKSNILDAICFVLGITNLSQVRANSLQELVYKQGQAGVTKASVTINFNNSDPQCSPIGYEKHKNIIVTRQIVIGGKNKFLINGRTCQSKEVETLFHSVQLNVNNPHFLIMQGRITKVLNMKPPEILSMIEEAAGTRMFETKKLNAQKTIEKKQLKVNEITTVMENEITPQLEKLRQERQSYSLWSSNSSELEKSERLLLAHQYHFAEQLIVEIREDKQKMEETIKQLEKEKETLSLQMEECDKKMIDIEKSHDQDSNDDIVQLRKVENTLSVQLVKLNSAYTNNKESLIQENEGLLNLQKQISSMELAKLEKEKELAKCAQQLALKEKELLGAEEEAVAVNERYQNALAGVADEQNAQLLSLPEQIATWEKLARESESKLQQGQLRSKHAQESLITLRAKAKKEEVMMRELQQETDRLRSNVATAEQKVQELNYNEIIHAETRARATTLRASVSQLRDKVEGLEAQVTGRLKFEYKDPIRDFDRSKVKGLVAQLVRVKDLRTALALEVAAGGKLHNVVVDSDQTSKLILEKGNLKKRTTFCPLNKITANCTGANKVRAAQELAQEKGSSAHLALDLVDFDHEVKKAMEYVFGSTIICERADVAHAVTFSPNIKTRSVTFDGDSYSTNGTLAGGSKSQIGEILVKLGELAAMKELLVTQESEWRTVDSQLKQLDRLAATWKSFSSTLRQSKHELASYEQRSAGSSTAQLLQEIKEKEDDITAVETESEKLHENLIKSSEELTKLRDTSSSVAQQRERAMKNIEDQRKVAETVAKKRKTELVVVRKKRDTLAAELAEIVKELDSIREQITTTEITVQKMSAANTEQEQQVLALQQQYKTAKKNAEELELKAQQTQKEIKALHVAKEKLDKKSKGITTEIHKLTSRVAELVRKSQEASKEMQELVKTHKWIEREKEYFGRQGSDFDFVAIDIEKVQMRKIELVAVQEKLSKTINKKVMGMIENAESQFEELRKKKDVILKDKSKIEAVMEELNIKKIEALERTWVRVNRDFGSIFSTLLPGAFAKVEPPEGCTVTDGLEVKVGFNNVWKDSLTELSGGQRSLLALSLILSLLLFKPAPMYILDEVDSALDLSHTENIGLMLRTHFSASQFIVVSLKEGMFNNANVIFRTRFVDGLSTVTRTCPGSRKGHGEIEAAGGSSSEPQKKKGKGGNTKGNARKVDIENDSVA